MRDGAHTLRSRASSFAGPGAPGLPNGRNGINGLVRNGSDSDGDGDGSGGTGVTGGKKASGRALASGLLGFGRRTPKIAPAKGGVGKAEGSGGGPGSLGRPKALSKWKAAGNVVIATNRSARGLRTHLQKNYHKPNSLNLNYCVVRWCCSHSKGCQ